MNISKTVRDGAISSKILTRRVVQEHPMQRGKLQFSPLLAAILDFSRKWKSVNISETVRDRAISSELLTRGVVQEYPIQRRKEYFMQRGKISMFTTFGGHLGF